MTGISRDLINPNRTLNIINHKTLKNLFKIIIYNGKKDLSCLNKNKNNNKRNKCDK